MNEREKLISYIESKNVGNPEEYYDLWIDTKNILLAGDLDLFYRSRCYAKWPELTVEEMDIILLNVHSTDKFHSMMKEEYGLG